MADRAFDLVVNSGVTMLESGSEVFRVQNTMEIMAQNLALQDFHVYVLTSGVFASADGGTLNAVRYVPVVSIHLGRVEAVNALSRNLADGKLDLPAAERALEEAQAMKSYGAPLSIGASALGAACFAFLFGGGAAEFLTALCCGMAESLLLQFARRRTSNRIFVDIAAAALCTVVALAVQLFIWPALQVSTATIGGLMVLTPGVAFTMAIRDFINADYLSGTIRLFDALLVASCLALGVALAYMLAHWVLGVAL